MVVGDNDEARQVGAGRNESDFFEGLHFHVQHDFGFHAAT
jgi:hypothetical protein